MKSTIIIAAANGFIGESLMQYFSKNYHVIGLVRKFPKISNGHEYQIWDGKTLGSWATSFENATAIINLAGKSVNCRYNDLNKAQIYSSRLESTRVIGEAIKVCKTKPKVWLNAASATIYAHSLERPNTEKNGIIGTGFSVDVCQQWEKSFNEFSYLGVRQIVLRTAIVLGKNGGVMVPFKNLVRFGAGGKMGVGNQQFSWIHENDVCKSMNFLIDNESLEGVFNIGSPFPVTNETFMRTLRNKMKIPFGIPNPTWLLKVGSRIIKSEAELILKSRFVLPERLLEAGYEFEFQKIEDCLGNLI
jgi:uncharacterized protein (TIGR01777 family)